MLWRAVTLLAYFSQAAEYTIQKISSLKTKVNKVFKKPNTKLEKAHLPLRRIPVLGGNWPNIMISDLIRH